MSKAKINFLDTVSNKKLIAILATVGFAVYFVALFNGFVWDDFPQIVDNNLVHSFSAIGTFFSGSTFISADHLTLVGAFYRPLQTMIFSSIYAIFGAKAFFFHFLPIILHILNASLVFILLKRFISRGISFFLSIIFLIHPLNVEAVAYISAYGTVISTTIGLAALLLVQRKNTQLVNVLAALILFTATLFYEPAIIFFILVFLYKYLFDKKYILAYAISSISALAVYFFMRIKVAHLYFAFASQTAQLPLLQRILYIPKIILFYLGTFIWPVKLAANQIWPPEGINFYNFALPWLIILAIIGLWSWTIKFYKNEQQKTKILIFFFFWTMAGLSFYFHFLKIDMTVAERWFYLPMVGLLGTLGLFFEKLNFVKWKKPLYFLLALIFIALSVRTIYRITDWKSNLILWQHDFTAEPRNYAVQGSLAAEYLKMNDNNNAQKYFELALSDDPVWGLSTDWFNLGVVYSNEGNYNKAKAAYENSIALGGNFFPYSNLATLCYSQKDFSCAKQDLLDAIKKYPDDAYLWYLLSLTEYQLGNKQQAMNDAMKSYGIDHNPVKLDLYNAEKNNFKINMGK